jgi:hypothetical protein
MRIYNQAYSCSFCKAKDKIMHTLLKKQKIDAFAKLREATISFVMFVCMPTWNIPAATERTLARFVPEYFFENVLNKFKFD